MVDPRILEARGLVKLPADPAPRRRTLGGVTVEQSSAQLPRIDRDRLPTILDFARQQGELAQEALAKAQAAAGDRRRAIAIAFTSGATFGALSVLGALRLFVNW